MSEQPKYTPWKQETFDFIAQYRDIFQTVADSIPGNKVSAEALAGAMAKELDAYLSKPLWEKTKDRYALSMSWPNLGCEADFACASMAGLIDRAGWESKTLFPVLMDMGPFNTQGATAFRALGKYQTEHNSPNDDPLDLKKYSGNCFDFLKVLSGFGGDQRETVRVAAAIWALRMADAYDWFSQKILGNPVSENYWFGLEQPKRDALLAQWVISGPVVMERLYNDNLAAHQGNYQPAPGTGGSGGWNVLGNSKAIGNAMGNPGYGVDPGAQGVAPDNVDWDIFDPFGGDPQEGTRETCPLPPQPPAPKPGPLPRRDPLVLDLNGDGIGTRNVKNGVIFDHDGDGFAELTGWVDRHDGLLVMDRNGDGLITDDKELFGDQTILKNGAKAANGFQALAEFDSNHDSKIDANDGAFSLLRVWQDSDLDGFSSPDELLTLDELGIQSINLDSTITNITDAQGNTQTRLGSFEKIDGTIGHIAECGLQRNTMYAIPTDWLAVPDDIESLPEIPGYGTLHDLHQAMVRDESRELKSLVERFVGASDLGSRNSLMDQILFAWAGTLDTDPLSRGADIDARKVGVLEKYFGQSFAGMTGSNLTHEGSVALNKSYGEIFERTYAQLMAQTHLKDLYAKIISTWDDAKQHYTTDMSGLIAELQAQLATDPVQGKELLGEFARTMRGLGHDRASCLPCREIFIQQDPSLGWVIDTGGLPVIEHTGQGLRTWSPHIEGTDGSEAILGSLAEGDWIINGFSGDDVIYGSSRNEWLIHETGDAVIVGGGGDDGITAGTGNDILDGGEGNDTIYGEKGNDTYIFRRGAGRDRVIETDTTANNVDTIWIGSFLTPDDIVVRRFYSDLVLKIINTDDSMTVGGFFAEVSTCFHSIEQVQFADGTIWGVNEMLQGLARGTEGDDYLVGGAGDDVIDALAGNDIVLGQDGNDTLNGGDGDDKLFGGAGNDTYLFARGSGQDTITDMDTTIGNVDTVFFGDLLPNEIVLKQSGRDLVISIVGTSDSLTLKDCFTATDIRLPIEKFRFVDGTEWDVNAIAIAFLSGTDGPDSITGFSSDDTILGLGGDDTLYGRAGDDTINGGLGNDLMYGESGDDTYLFGRFSGHDTVLDRDRTLGNTDIIQLADDITPGDVTLRRYGDDLALFINDTGDQLIVRKWFWNDSDEYRVEYIQFSDGTVWDVADIKDVAYSGTEDNDILIGYETSDTIRGLGGDDGIAGREGDDVLDGGGGDDHLYGEDGGDRLTGGEGDDWIEGGKGCDVLNGGAGNDYLDGGGGKVNASPGFIYSGFTGYFTPNGSDTFLFGRGFGNDTVIDYDTTAGNVDTILLNPDVAPSDVSLRRDGGNLVLSIDGAIDTLTVYGWFQDDESTDWQVEQIQFFGGTIWGVDAIKLLVLQGTPEDDLLLGYSSADTIPGMAGDDSIYGNAGADVLDGGAGDDYLNGGDGNDTYIFGRGSGQDIIGDIDDTAGNIDTIAFNADVTAADLTLTAYGQDLFISINGTDDRLQLRGWFLDDAHKIERLQFSDGTIWDAAYMQGIASAPTDTDDYIVGTPANDAIDSGGGNDTIFGREGDDQLFGGSGDDLIHGEDGNDTMYGGAGADTIEGGTGTNVLSGNAGDDRIVADQGRNTILLNRGDGFDRITSHFIDPDSEPDTIVFGPGITPDDLMVNLNIDNSGGTVQVAPDSGFTYIPILISVNGILFFTADDGIHGLELWTSDGTDGGTVLHKDINPGSGSGSPHSLADVAGTLFFTAWDGLWRSDGTEAGTILVAGVGGDNLTNVNGTLFFQGYDATHGYELWKSDGTEAGTVMVKDIYSGSGDSMPYSLTAVDNTLYFVARDVRGGELWKSDGTAAGTVLVKDIRGGTEAGWVANLTEVNGTLFFTADDGVHGGELWKTDGTAAGTAMVKDINPDSASGVDYDESADPINVNGILFFTANDGVHGSELWRSDGTDAGTALVKDVNPGSDGSVSHGSGSDRVNVNGILFFTADDGIHGTELWRSDGTEAGTVMVKDINSGYDAGVNYYSCLTDVNGTLFFTASDGVHGLSLWKTDGTEAGTVMVREMIGFAADLRGPGQLTDVDGTLFFVNNYKELWKSDGSTNSNMELTIDMGDGEGVLIQADASGTEASPTDLAIKRFVFDDGTMLTLEDILARANAVSGYQEGSAGNDVLQGQDTDDEIYGGDGNDTIRAGAGNDIIDAGAGTDIIDAGEGDDVIQGLQGGDTAVGAQGNDTYSYNLGDGKVSIADVAAPGEGNSIVFGQGISAGVISLIASSDTLTLHINDNGDEIALKVFDQAEVFGEHAVDTFVFADGTTLSYTELLQRGFDIAGTEGEDLLIGTSGQDRITALGGDDIIVSGPGSDLLDGGSGNDTYVFNVNDGVDTIVDGASPGAGNVVDFGIGISSSDLILSTDGNTLVITVGSTGDALRLEGFDPNDPYDTISVETFRFADGTVLDATQLLDLGFTFEGTPGDDTLTGTGARDLFIGHEGSDQLIGGAGDDAYMFHSGDGADTIVDQSTLMEPNMLIFGTGITSDSVTLNYDATNHMLVLNLGSNGDAVQLSDFDAADPYSDHAVEYFQFGDGQILTYSQLIDKGFDLIGTEADDTLTGTAATDRIFGGAGNDTLSGYAGDDTLSGGAGDDTYTFNLGDGVDLIDDVATAGEGNTLKFGEGIAVADLDRHLTFRDGMLIIRVGTNGDEVHLTGFDPNAADYGSRAVQTFEFFDGTVLSYEELVENTFIVQGDSSDNDITGTNMTDRLYGYEGFDRLNGGLGNDTLTGGIGNDELLGEEGSDMYVFHLGDGVDTIVDTASSGEGNQILFADDTITRDSVSTHLEGSTLVIEYGDQGDAIRLLNFEYNTQHVVDIIEFADGTQVPLTSFVDPGTEGDDVILGTYYADTIDAKGGNDTVTSFEGNDTIQGGTGNDIIDAGAGDDLIAGGPGNDTLVGGEGQDTYVFNLGDGMDTIVDTAKLGEGNVISFGAGITRDNISVQVDGTTLTIQYGDQGDAIVLPNFDFNTQHVVETLQFADGSSMRLPSLVDPGTEGDDTIVGSYFEDVINAKGGNDTVTTFESDDIVYGGTGNDIIDAGAGYDLIVGGPGDDTLSGGPGNDTYVFNLADGVDTIIDTAFIGEGNKIQFGPGITVDDLKLSYQDTTLIIDVGAAGDQLRLSGFDREDALGTHAVDRFEFSDGTSVTYEQLINRGFDLVGTDGDDTILGTNVTDRIQGLAGNDFLDAGPGADVLTGGLGDDTYVVDDPADVVVENPNEGIDTVQSSITYTIASHVENLTLTGTEAINGTGNELDNVLTGNDADNVLDGGLGADTLQGGAGNDTYVVDNTADIVLENADQGTDIIQSSVSYTLAANVENLTLTGTASINGTGNELDNVLTGNDADNVIDGLAGADIMVGGAGNDRYIVDNAADVVSENPFAGIDTVDSLVSYMLGANVENLVLTGMSSIDGTGNGLNNTLIGNIDANVLMALAGDDLLAGGLGNDTLDGGTGSDTYIFNLGDGVDTIIDTSTAEEGNVVQFGAGIALADLKLSYEGDTLIVKVGANGDEVRLAGFDPQDALGSHAVDLFRFADGSSITYADLINQGFDLVGTDADDTIVGTNVNDRIQGLGGSDTINADVGNDLVDGGPGADTLIGGAGDDRYLIDDEADVAVEEPDQGMDTVESSVSYSLGANLENLLLVGYAAVNGTGNDLNNLLQGNGADNVLTGSLGNDTLQGGDGNDTYVFNTGDGLDTVTDTTGTDTIRLGQGITKQSISVKSDNLGIHIRLIDAQGNATSEGIDINVTEDGSPAVETIQFADGSTAQITDLLNPVNIVYGTNRMDFIRTGETNDIIYAQGGTDVVFAGGGNDIVYGGSGSDFIFGEAGDDTLYGEDSMDLLFGGTGDDTLDGGTGVDVLVGGAGNDTYVVDSSSDMVIEAAGEGTDIVESSVTYSLGWNVEKLTLTGNASINGSGNSSDNVLVGNSGANRLSGGLGNDILDGGAGSDILEGGKGNDTYLLGQGSGQDRIVENDRTRGNTDTLLFGPGVSADELWFRHLGNDLEVSIIGTEDKVTISDWYKGTAHQVEQFKTSEGQALLNNQVDLLVQAMASFAPPAAGQTTLPDAYQNTLHPVIVANWK